jgi:hypothetical protein
MVNDLHMKSAGPEPYGEPAPGASIRERYDHWQWVISEEDFEIEMAEDPDPDSDEEFDPIEDIRARQTRHIQIFEEVRAELEALGNPDLWGIR